MDKVFSIIKLSCFWWPFLFQESLAKTPFLFSKTDMLQHSCYLACQRYHCFYMALIFVGLGLEIRTKSTYYQL